MLGKSGVVYRTRTVLRILVGSGDDRLRKLGGGGGGEGGGGGGGGGDKPRNEGAKL